jgi:hypothetical protein
MIEPLFKLYRGRTISQENFIAGTYTGSNDSTDLTSVVLHPSMVLTGVFIGGDVGATATLTITGETEIPG